MGFWQKSAWELGFGPNLGWELGFGTSLHDPLFWLAKLLAQRSQTGGGTGEGGGGRGKSTVASVGQATRYVFKCLCNTSFL